MERIMILGAGRTGRGFVGRLAAEAGIPVTFVDKDADLIEGLRKAKEEGGYTVRFYGDEREPVRISDYKTEILSDKTDFSGISLVMVSVGGSHLAEAGAWLAKVLPANRLIYVITCENASSPADTLQNAIGLPNVLVSEAAVFCTTNADGADILSEDFGIAVRSGAHCAPRMHEALGTTAQGAVRFSFGYFNTMAEADAAVEAVRSIAEE